MIWFPLYPVSSPEHGPTILLVENMSKDPAFLFYPADAAQDVSHMNRLERGCYFDLIQAQNKFGGITVELARKALGKNFEDCWNSIELILEKEGDKYYVGWLRDSIIKRKEHTELQRRRIRNYWDLRKNHSADVLLG